MLRLVKFLFGVFADREGATRASAATIAAVATCWLIFTPSITFLAFKAGQDHQNKLMWKDHALIRDALQHADIFVPTLTDEDEDKKPKNNQNNE